MATMEGGDSKPKTVGLGVGDLKKEAKTLEEFLKLPSVTRINYKQAKPGGPINYSVPAHHSEYRPSVCFLSFTTLSANWHSTNTQRRL